jgi:hypothetical protein
MIWVFMIVAYVTKMVSLCVFLRRNRSLQEAIIALNEIKYLWNFWRFHRTMLLIFLNGKKWKLEAGVTNFTTVILRRATGYPGPGIIPSDARSFYTTLEFVFLSM